MSEYLKAVQERVVIYDGAMGTNIQASQPAARRLLGQGRLQRHPGAEPARHDRATSMRRFLRSAAMWWRRIPSTPRASCMAEYEMADKVHEVNLAAAKLAREVAAAVLDQRTQAFCRRLHGPDHQAAFARAISALTTWSPPTPSRRSALIEGGVDVLLLETCQDILQAKAGLVGIFDALKQAGKKFPVQVQVTLEATGHHAARHRNRRGADHAGDVRRGRYRHELRYRSQGDERRRPLPGR